MNNTLIKGLAILETLCRSSRPMGVTEIAARLQLPKSNVHRMLRALVELRYVMQEQASGTYMPSLRVWALGSSMLAHVDLLQVAEPMMQALRVATGDNVHLAMLDGAEVVYLRKLDSPRQAPAFSQVGDRGHAHCVAVGKAILAWHDAARLGQLARRLKPFTARSITDPALFLKDMAQVRRRGYAVNLGGWREGVNGVAAPIRDGTHRVIASIGVSGPAGRLEPARIRAVGPQVVAAAHDISFALGGKAGNDAARELSLRMRRLPAIRSAVAGRSLSPKPAQSS